VDGGALFPIAGPFTKEPIFGFPPQKKKGTVIPWQNKLLFILIRESFTQLYLIVCGSVAEWRVLIALMISSNLIVISIVTSAFCKWKLLLS